MLWKSNSLVYTFAWTLGWTSMSSPIPCAQETEESHTDMPEVQKAELNMKEVADAINEAKRRKELGECCPCTLTV